VTPDFIEIEKNGRKPFRFDAGDCPDLFPPLVALASSCEGISRITGVDRLRFKESDRAAALAREFTALGAVVGIEGNAMTVAGGKIRGGAVSSHGDHRIAMAAAVAAVAAEQPVTIGDSEAVAKSYPSFFEELASIGGKVDEQLR
jgi:3-phosphoshikimate 1-carboxyvinyltransferase